MTARDRASPAFGYMSRDCGGGAADGRGWSGCGVGRGPVEHSNVIFAGIGDIHVIGGRIDRYAGCSRQLAGAKGLEGSAVFAASGLEVADEGPLFIGEQVAGHRIGRQARDRPWRDRFGDLPAFVELRYARVVCTAALVDVACGVDGDPMGQCAVACGNSEFTELRPALAVPEYSFRIDRVHHHEVATGVDRNAGKPSKAGQLAGRIPFVDQIPRRVELRYEVAERVGDVDVARGGAGGVVDRDEGRRIEGARS